MSEPDSTATAAATADPRWPVVHPSTTRFVWLCRAAAVVALAYGVTMLVLGLLSLDASVWLWVAIAVGGLLHLAGVSGLWLLAPRSPSWRRPGHGSPAEKRQAMRDLLTGTDLDPDGRRMVAEVVASSARLPVGTAFVFACIGPVLIGTSNSAPPLPWLGAVTAVGVLLMLAAMVASVWRIRRWHRAAERADALPLVDGQDAPYRLW